MTAVEEPEDGELEPTMTLKERTDHLMRMALLRHSMATGEQPTTPTDAMPKGVGLAARDEPDMPQRGTGFVRRAELLAAGEGWRDRVPTVTTPQKQRGVAGVTADEEIKERPSFCQIINEKFEHSLPILTAITLADDMSACESSEQKPEIVEPPQQQQQHRLKLKTKPTSLPDALTDVQNMTPDESPPLWGDNLLPYEGMLENKKLLLATPSENDIPEEGATEATGTAPLLTVLKRPVRAGRAASTRTNAALVILENDDSALVREIASRDAARVPVASEEPGRSISMEEEAPKPQFRIPGRPRGGQRPFSMMLPQELLKEALSETKNKLKPRADAATKLPMLFQIKGHSRVVATLVPCRLDSLNSGDVFLCVCARDCFLWLGKDRSLMEERIGRQLASQVIASCEFGCKSRRISELTDGEELETKAFKLALPDAESSSVVHPADPSGCDRLFEQYWPRTIAVYEVDGVARTATPLPREPLSHSILKSQRMLLIDCVSELYLWCGQFVPETEKAVGLELLEKRRMEPLPEELAINPLGAPVTERPDWCLIGKVSQHLESSVFKSKFHDWPETASLAPVNVPVVDVTKVVKLDVQPFDFEEVLSAEEAPVDLEIGTTHVGRGDGWSGLEDGLRRTAEIITILVTLQRYGASGDLEEMPFDPENSLVHLYSTQSYVITWKFRANNVSVKRIKDGAPATHQTGREQTAAFVWRGSRCRALDAGHTALTARDAVGFDADKFAIVEGQEPAAFLRLFKGRLVIKMDAEPRETKLYQFCGSIPDESYMMEVPAVSCSLRHITCALLVHFTVARVWRGAHASDQLTAAVTAFAPLLGAGDVVTEPAGEESGVIAKLLAPWSSPALTPPLSADPASSSACRLFAIAVTTGRRLGAREILSPSRDSSKLFPFYAAQLLNAPTPAQFLLVTGSHVYVWLHRPSVDTPSWTRSLTALCDSLAHVSGRAVVVTYANAESVNFLSFFPSWPTSEEPQPPVEKSLEDLRKSLRP